MNVKRVFVVLLTGIIWPFLFQSAFAELHIEYANCVKKTAALTCPDIGIGDTTDLTYYSTCSKACSNDYIFATGEWSSGDACFNNPALYIYARGCTGTHCNHHFTAAACTWYCDENIYTGDCEDCNFTKSGIQALGIDTKIACTDPKPSTTNTNPCDSSYTMTACDGSAFYCSSSDIWQDIYDFLSYNSGLVSYWYYTVENSHGVFDCLAGGRYKDGSYNLPIDGCVNTGACSDVGTGTSYLDHYCLTRDAANALNDITCQGEQGYLAAPTGAVTNTITNSTSITNSPAYTSNDPNYWDKLNVLGICVDIDSDGYDDHTGRDCDDVEAGTSGAAGDLLNSPASENDGVLGSGGSGGGTGVTVEVSGGATEGQVERATEGALKNVVGDGTTTIPGDNLTNYDTDIDIPVGSELSNITGVINSSPIIGILENSGVVTNSPVCYVNSVLLGQDIEISICSWEEYIVLLGNLMVAFAGLYLLIIIFF